MRLFFFSMLFEMEQNGEKMAGKASALRSLTPSSFQVYFLLAMFTVSFFRASAKS